MEKIPATHSRKRSKRGLIGRYRTTSVDAEEEVEVEPEGEAEMPPSRRDIWRRADRKNAPT